MKTCADCEQTKSAAEFYRTAKGGLMHICKACHRYRMKVRRLTNPYVQQYERERSKHPERKLHLQSNARKWREDHPDGYRAQNAVNNAIRDGKMVKEPCALCGTTQNIQGHHKNYAEPLNVTWLCAKCHQRLHATFPELGGHFEPRA